MQLAFSPRAQFAALAVANAIVIGVTSGQGPAPSLTILEECEEEEGSYADKSLAAWPVEALRATIRKGH